MSALGSPLVFGSEFALVSALECALVCVLASELEFGSGIVTGKQIGRAHV